MMTEVKICPKCKAEMEKTFRLCNVFWVHVPTWLCHSCGYSEDRS